MMRQWHLRPPPTPSAPALSLALGWEDISEEEMVMQSVLVCREAMEQGVTSSCMHNTSGMHLPRVSPRRLVTLIWQVHVGDVLDMLVGLTPELKDKVRVPASQTHTRTYAHIHEVEKTKLALRT